MRFEALHNIAIIYRDLKPKNIMVDWNGYLKLVDFGFAKSVPRRTYTVCGTPEYFSPELVAGIGYGKGNDVWALGILTYELLFGRTPFGTNDDPQKLIYKRILQSSLSFPSECEDVVGKDLIEKLLLKDERIRLGCGRFGINGVKRHEWFKSLDWNLLLRHGLRSPWQPPIRDNLDTSNFELYDQNYKQIPFDFKGDIDPFYGF